MKPEDVIARLGLKPLNMEGGFYAETYRSEERLPQSALASGGEYSKNMCTAIYYLLTRETFSALHRLPGDEIYHFYLGSPVTMVLLHPGGHAETVVLGSDLEKGHRLQTVVPKKTWQGSFLPDGDFALMGTTMAPGFDFADYEPGDRERLIREYPHWKDLIKRLTP